MCAELCEKEMVLERLLMLAHAGEESREGSMLGPPAIRFFAAAIDSVSRDAFLSPSHWDPTVCFHIIRNLETMHD